MKEEIKLDLKRFMGPNSKILSGRDEGEYARKILQINILDNDDNSYNVTVPKDTWSINSSFFLGLFGESIRYLGETSFKVKYKFDFADSLLNDVEEGIKDALK